MNASERNAPLDIAEQGRRDGQTIRLDRRLFMNFTAFGNCPDLHLAGRTLAEFDIEGAVYADVNDPSGIGVVALAEDPTRFVTDLRQALDRLRRVMTHKPGFDMLGRTYAIGYESDLEHVLLARPRERILEPATPWAVWYPLQRAKAFYKLDASHQRSILAEHGAIGRRFGESGLAADVRFACHGLDTHDNDFVIGLVGQDLHPLSILVQTMRGTEQTSEYLSRLGPFFVGRAIWHSPLVRS